MPALDVVTKKVNAQTVAAVRDVIPTYSDIGPLFEELCSYLGEQKAQWAGAPIAIYYDMEFKERDVDVEVAVPIIGSLTETDRIKVHELPAAEQMACVIHQGSYETISETYKAMGTWIESNGYQLTGPDREIYLKGPESNEDPAAYVTELQFPVAKK